MTKCEQRLREALADAGRTGKYVELLTVDLRTILRDLSEARTAAREARRAALEAAAKVCDDYGASMDNEYNRSAGDIARLGIETAEECAAAIRALMPKGLV